MNDFAKNFAPKIMIMNVSNSMIFVIVIVTYSLTRLIIAYNNLIKNNFCGCY